MTAVDAQSLTLAVDGVPLEYVDGSGGSLTLDRRWTPYIQGEVTVVAPVDPSILDPRITPVLELTWVQRYGPKLQITLDLTADWAGMLTSDLTLVYAGDLTSDISTTPGRWWGDAAEPSSIVARVMIRDQVNQYDGTYRLKLEGVDARFRDYPNTRPHREAVPATTVRTVYNALRSGVLTNPMPAGVLTLAEGGDDADLKAVNVRDGEVVWASGSTLFEAVMPYLGELRLWGSEDGRIILDKAPAAPPTLTLTDATIVGAEETNTIDNDAWGDGLLIEYEQKSDDPQVWNFVRYNDASAPFAPVIKYLHIVLPGESPFSDIAGGVGSIPWPEGDLLYGPLLARAKRRYRTIPVRAVNNFNARPDTEVTLVGLPDTPDLVGVVAAVTWSIDDGEMALTLEGIEEA